MMTSSDQKRTLRKHLLEKRNAISDRDWEEKSKRIHDRFLQQFDLDDHDHIHVYISMDQRKEVETLSLIDFLFSHRKRVTVPVTQFEPPMLKHSRLQNIQSLSPNKWGVMEPNTFDEVTIEDVSLIIVPLVGADEDKNRLGYGKGFYDRFLSKTEVITVGFCFEECLVKKVPTEDFDIPLDYIITDKKVII